jgi:hypothetical protein
MGLLNRAVRGKTQTTPVFNVAVEPQVFIPAKRPPQKRGLLNRVSQKKNLENTVMETFDNQQNDFQGIVIEALNYSPGGFSGRIFSMVSGFGSAQSLAPGRCLVVFSANLDGELIAGHIAKTVSGKNIFHFRAETPHEAFALIKPYL